MPNQTKKLSFNGFQQRLDSFKTKIQLQQILAQSLLTEFEALTSEFQCLKGLVDASLGKFDSSLVDFDSSSENFDTTSWKFDSLSSNFDSTSEKFDTTSIKSDASSLGFDSTSYNNGTTSIKLESSLPKDDTATSVRKLAALFQRSAREVLKINFSQSNIPNRIGLILLALKTKQRLSVAEMRQITGVSRASLVRDLKVLKLLGWLEFHGSRKNGYFTLTSSFQVS